MKKNPFVILFLISLPLIIFTNPGSLHYRQRPDTSVLSKLEKTVRYLTQTVHPRNADNIDNLNRSVEYIKEFFVSSGARVTAQGVPDWLLRLCAW